jgi:hypothetical protein
MIPLRERIHDQVDRLDETLLPEVAKTLDALEMKKPSVEETLALWEQLAEPLGERQEHLVASLERRPLFGGRGLDREPD